MTLVTGDIRLVTNKPDSVSQVWLRAPKGRVQGTAYVTESPDAVQVNNGAVSFTALPGPLVMVLVAQGQPLNSVKLIVPDKANATLRECIEAVGLADDGTLSALEELASEVARVAAQIASADQLETWATETMGAAQNVQTAINTWSNEAASVTQAIQESAERAESAAEVATEEIMQQITEVVGQPNYVALMASRSHYSTMTVRKTSASGALEVKCANTDGEQFVAYTVTAPNRYQYIGGVSASNLDPATREINFDELTTTGTYSAVTTSPYTTQVGATWQVEIEVAAASTIQMRHYADHRGGVWRVSVVETPGLTVDISTFDLTAGIKYPTLFTIPTAGAYTIRGEFLGEDPDNPPTTGVPARGWLGALGSEEWTLSVPNSSGGISTVELSPLSNKDFAFRMKPAGTDANSEFIPYHGTASEAFASPTQYYNAGAPLDIDALPVGEPVPVDSFEIVQHIYGRNSSAPNPTQNIAEFWTTQKIAPDGTYYVSGRWKTLVDIEMHSSAYPMMLMGRLPLFDEVISSVGTSHAVSGENTPRNIWLTQERDLPEGYAMLSSTSDYVAAVQVDARRETLRAGAPDKPGNMTYIELRTGGIMAKVYQRIYDTGVIVPAGTIQRFGGSYWYGAIPGMHSVLSLS